MKICSVEGCNKPHKAKTFCDGHYRMFRRNGSPSKYKPKGNIDNNGYLRIRKSGKNVFAHRIIMEEKLGRSLTDEETVHHINGNRLDNRIENLELWSSRQPSGQRIQDKVKYAKEILMQYDQNPDWIKEFSDYMKLDEIDFNGDQ